MAEEKAGLGEINFRKLFPWTELFRSFQVALDPKKLLLAAAGIMVMSLGWWVLGWIFFDSQTKPEWVAYQNNSTYPDDTPEVQVTKRWRDFKEARRQWNILYAAAGTQRVQYDAAELARTPDEVKAVEEQLKKAADEGKKTIVVGGLERSILAPEPGFLRTLPFFENRGPNPYLVVTGQTAVRDAGPIADWLTHQASVLVEPLTKIFSPLILLLSPRTGLLNRCYFLLVTLVTLATWALFGGAITRMAVVQVARNDKVGIVESLRFVTARYLSYFSAPLFPLAFVAVLVFLVAVPFGLLYLIPVVGDIVVAGLGLPLVLGAAIAMAVVLVGLVGWPMMNATISSEGSDSFDALSRSYSYVYQSPWSYLGYSLVSIAYGAVVVFFIGFMGSLVVLLGKWSLSQTPFVEMANREPSFLFVYAPTSFEWRTLLLDGATTADGESVVKDGKIDPTAYQQFLEGVKTPGGTIREGTGLNWWNYAGAGLVAAWLYLFFLMVLGFGYSFFWSASTLIYLLMRRKVDDTDMDEIYLAEDEPEEPYSAPPTVSSTTAPPVSTSTPLTMVDPPLRSSAPPPTSGPTPPITLPVTPAAEPAHSGPAADVPGKIDGDGEAKL